MMLQILRYLNKGNTFFNIYLTAIILYYRCFFLSLCKVIIMSKKIWSAEDIYAGMYLVRTLEPIEGERLQFAKTITYKLGFTNSINEKKYHLISVLTDGWVYPFADTKEDVANFLNRSEHGYRRLTKAEFIAMVESSDQGFTDNF